jgi:hypothetical protein
VLILIVFDMGLERYLSLRLTGKCARNEIAFRESSTGLWFVEYFCIIMLNMSDCTILSHDTSL